MNDGRTDALDALLARPLDEVADDGFSSRVVARVSASERRRHYLAFLVPLIGVCALVPFLPFSEFGDTMAHLPPMLAGSGPIALALAALILTFSLEQRLRA